MDLSIPALILGGIGTATGVIGLILRLFEKRKERAQLFARADWGYYEERSTSHGERRASAHVEVFVDNRGKRGTTIKRVVGTVPAEGGGEMMTEGRVSEAGNRIPIPLAGDASELLELTFDFAAGSPRFEANYTTPAASAMGFAGQHLPIKIIVYHTYGQVETRFAAYPKDSSETRLIRHLSLRLERE